MARHACPNDKKFQATTPEDPVSGLGLMAIGAGLFQVLLSALLLFGGLFQGLSRRLFALVLLGVAGYLVAPLVDSHPVGWVLAVALSTMVPGMFWLFCASVFDDHYSFPAWQPALVALSVILPLLFEGLGLPQGGAGDWLLRGLPQFLEFVFLALALWAIFRHWREDLVAGRRRLRFWFCASAGVFIFVLILSREVLFEDASWLQETQYLATALVLLGTNALLLRYPAGFFDPIHRPEPLMAPDAESKDPETPPGAAQQLAHIRRLVVTEGIHREHGMTIGKLAAAADIPEYRLRSLINGGLGYRNFNDFLNRFRIDEASERLADPGEVRTPVLTIALDVGFRSISSFNKSFKDTHGVTPTAYRKAHAGDPETH